MKRHAYGKLSLNDDMSMTYFFCCHRNAQIARATVNAILRLALVDLPPGKSPNKGTDMSKTLSVLVATMFAVSTGIAAAQTPAAKSDPAKATPATPATPAAPATPAKGDAAKATPATPATSATPATPEKGKGKAQDKDAKAASKDAKSTGAPK